MSILITFYEPNWERTVRGACAEDLNNTQTQETVDEVFALIENNSYLYRIESVADGSFVGYVVYEGNGVATFSYDGTMTPKTGKIRPQFATVPAILADYNTIITTPINNLI